MTKAKRELPQIPVGICRLMIRRVRLTGYGGTPNKYIPVGTEGDLEVHEGSIDREIIQGNFYPKRYPDNRPCDGNGFGSVIWPKIELVDPQAKRELVGFQIASADYTDMPDDYPSFEVLSAAMIEAFFKRTDSDLVKTKGWLVHPVYEGDIEEPFNVEEEETEC